MFGNFELYITSLCVIMIFIVNLYGVLECQKGTLKSSVCNFKIFIYWKKKCVLIFKLYKNIHFCTDFEKKIYWPSLPIDQTTLHLHAKTKTTHFSRVVASSHYLDKRQTFCTFWKHTLGFVGVKLCPVDMKTLENIIKQCLGMYAWFSLFLETLFWSHALLICLNLAPNLLPK